MGFLRGLWRFSRPHTVKGTTISLFSVALLTLDSPSQLLSPYILFHLLFTLFVSLCMNIFIVGINQMYDVEIDKINKPTLPIASGELSVTQGWSIVFSVAFLSLSLSYIYGTTVLFLTLLLPGLLGILYSVPPFRFKRFPLLAMSCIFIVRGVIVQFGFYFYVKQLMAMEANPSLTTSTVGIDFAVTRPLIFASVFILLFAMVIAIFKDIPDLEGDKAHSISSFTVQLGVEKVFQICVSMLLFDYGLGVLIGLLSDSLLSGVLTSGFHAAMAALIWRKSQRTVMKEQKSLTEFYMFIWKLFYAQYLVFPLVR